MLSRVNFVPSESIFDRQCQRGYFDKEVFNEATIQNTKWPWNPDS